MSKTTIDLLILIFFLCWWEPKGTFTAPMPFSAMDLWAWQWHLILAIVGLTANWDMLNWVSVTNKYI